METTKRKTESLTKENWMKAKRQAKQMGGWCKKKKHNLNWLSDVKRRDWLSLELARDFVEYCGCMMV